MVGMLHDFFHIGVSVVAKSSTYCTPGKLPGVFSSALCPTDVWMKLEYLYKSYTSKDLSVTTECLSGSQ